MFKNKYRQFQILSICSISTFTFLTACTPAHKKELTFQYHDGQECRQIFNERTDTVNCICKREHSTNYTKYAPNWGRPGGASRPGTDAYCLTPTEFKNLPKF
jgi:hypothetical protein